MNAYLLGVDGGGSSTEFCLGDMQGNVLFSVFSGSSSFKSVGREEALANIRDGLRQLEERGISLGEISKGVWGLSGCDTPEDQALYEEMLSQAGLGSNHRVVNDGLLAFWARAEAPGMVSVAGTGSIVLGFDSRGASYRLGGWHYAFSDLGSGYWMGCSLLRELALWLEGCREEDPVFRRVCGERPAQEVLCSLSNLTEGKQLAAYARPVLDTAESPLCNELRTRAAEYLCRYAKTMEEKVRMPGRRTRVVLSGGLFQNPGFRQLVSENLLREMDAEVIWQDNSPALGGLRLAK